MRTQLTKTPILLVAVGLTILVTALFMPWLLIFGISQPPAFQDSTMKPLHTSGHMILDSSNSVIYLRGIGRAGDLDSLSGTWGGIGDNVFDYSEKWQTDSAVLTAKMDETFACYRDIWHVNMIRLLIPVDWWWLDNVNPSAVQSGSRPNDELPKLHRTSRAGSSQMRNIR